MGCWRTVLPVHPPTDVCTCHWIWAEGSREVNLLHSPPGLPKLDSKADVSAVQLVGYQMSSKETGHLYCQVYALKRLPRPPQCGLKRAQEILRDIVSSLKDCLWQEERGAVRRKWRNGACQHSSNLPLQPSLPERKVGHFGEARTCWGQGGPSVCPGSCCCAEGMHRKAHLVHHYGQGWMSANVPRAKTSQEEGPRCRAAGAIGSHQRKATKLGPLHWVQLTPINGSLSWT